MMRIAATSEQNGETQLALDAWEVRHLASLWLTVVGVLFAGFWRQSEHWMIAATIYAVFCGGMLVIAHVFRLLIYDSFLQFQYKEKFGLFIFHLIVLFVPWLLGYPGGSHALAALLVLLCGQAVSPLGTGRIYAAAALLGMLTLTAPPYPPLYLTAGWMLCMLSAIRHEHVRFRLERYGSRQSLPRREALRGLLRPVLVPWFLAIGVFWLSKLILPKGMKRLEFHTGVSITGVSPEVGAVSMSEVMWDGLVLAGLIIATLIVLNWLERKLRGKQKATVQLGDGRLAVSEEIERLERNVEPVEADVVTDDPRGKILVSFRTFARTLALSGWGRRDGETPREYLLRLCNSLLHGAEIAAPIPRQFNRACYSRENLTEEDAREFLRHLHSIEPMIQQEIDARRD